MLISLVGLFVLPLTSAQAVLFFVIPLIVNATGAIGDLYMSARLLLAPRHVLIQDVGEAINRFAPTILIQDNGPTDP